MTLPRHGSRSASRRSARSGPRRADWSAAAWAWDSGPDPAIKRRIRRLQRAQRLAKLRAEIAEAALRHPSMAPLPFDDGPDLSSGAVPSS